MKRIINAIKSVQIGACLLALPIQALAQSDNGAAGTGVVATVEAFEFPSCPIEPLRQAYRSLLTEEDTFNVLAVEEQILLVCRERQQLIQSYTTGAQQISESLRTLLEKKNEIDAAQARLDQILADTETAQAQYETSIENHDQLLLRLDELQQQLGAINTELADIPESVRLRTQELTLATIKLQRINRETAAAEAEYNRLLNNAGALRDQVADAGARAGAGNVQADAESADGTVTQQPVVVASNSCEFKYSLLGTGVIRGESYAMIADEINNTSLNLFVGEFLPSGEELVKISDSSVLISNGEFSHVLPNASANWALANNQDGGTLTHGFLWSKVEQASAGNQGGDENAIQVFRGFELN